MAKNNRWIQGAIKHPGALTRTAKRAKAIKKGGGIKKAWLNKAAKKPGRLGKQARLALNLSRMRKR